MVQDKMKILIDAVLDERHENRDNETERDEHFVGQGIQRMKALIHDRSVEVGAGRCNLV